MEIDSLKPDSKLPWVEKFRPSSLASILSNTDIISTITRLIDANNLPNLLLYGPPGTGKTTTILACARKMNGKYFNSMVLELNASDERGIDVVREQIKDFASTRQIFGGGSKLIILDEADMMTKDAQFALRRVIEKYSKNVRFCLICNYSNKIIPALQSRCTKFRFAPLESKEVVSRLKEIADIEKVTLSDEGANAIYKLSGGDMRKCLNIMQATSLAFDEINEINVYKCTGHPLPQDIENVMHILLNTSVKQAYNDISTLQIDRGLALVDLVTNLSELLLTIVMPPSAKALLLDKMADIEHRMSVSCSERLQLGALVGAFQLARYEMAKFLV